jgi:hypothetical protein
MARRLTSTITPRQQSRLRKLPERVLEFVRAGVRHGSELISPASDIVPRARGGVNRLEVRVERSSGCLTVQPRGRPGGRLAQGLRELLRALIDVPTIGTAGHRIQITL